ncbi:hypothetical protein [Niallia oryzisoli]|uniref:hypothetical protein n=1 Tax=Niallia oryzisoli TaxID=1737571 RepID=UPI003BB21BEE
MERYDKTVEDIDMIIVCTLTPDFKTPSVASSIKVRLNINNTGAMDLKVACAGFTYELYATYSLYN